jgi:hypothetical protein
MKNYSNADTSWTDAFLKNNKPESKSGSYRAPNRHAEEHAKWMKHESDRSEKRVRLKKEWQESHREHSQKGSPDYLAPRHVSSAHRAKGHGLNRYNVMDSAPPKKDERGFYRSTQTAANSFLEANI